METTLKAETINYKNFHLWMLVPFAISILGFSYSYYTKLSSATFHQHVHGISATIWYILVIVQPYLIVRMQNVETHKMLGMIALIFAGIVAGSAFAIIPNPTNKLFQVEVVAP